MDDLHLLLPGLKVSSGLIRQRPLSPTEQDGCQDASSPPTPVGSKRRHVALGGKDDDRHSEGAVAKRHHQQATATATSDVRPKQRLPRRLRAPSLSSPARDPIFAGLEAGITSTMLDDLSDSPKVSPTKSNPCPLGTAAPSDSPRSEDAMAASAACADAQDADFQSRLPSASEVSSRLHQLLESDARHGPCQPQPLASCPGSLPPRPSSSASSAATATVTLSCASSMSDGQGWCVEASVTPEMFQKRKSAPSRIEVRPGTSALPGDSTPCTVSAGTRTHDTACTAAAPSPTAASAASSAPGIMAGGQVTPPRGQQCSLSKAEKWHERINVATMRLRARSLPVTPQRGRAVQSLAAQ